MAGATKYVDNVNGNNGNTGDSEAQAYADIPTAIAAITGGGNIIYVQNAGSSYTLTSTIAITAGLKGDTTDGKNRIEGYTTTPGARDGRPTITSATNSVALFTLNDNDLWDFVHIKHTHTAATRGNAYVGTTANSAGVTWKDCVFDGCLRAVSGASLIGAVLSGAAAGNTASTFIGCEITNCTGTDAALLVHAGCVLDGCDIHDNGSCDAIRGVNGNSFCVLAIDTIFDTNAIAINDISTSSQSHVYCHGCVFVDNTSDGIKSAAKAANSICLQLVNNVFYGNGGYGINQLDTQAEADANVRINRNNAFGSNTSGAYTGLSAGQGEITLTADPFSSKAGRDFAPNTTAGGGALLRAAAFPTTWPGGTTTSYRDVGAVQHKDNAGILTGTGLVRT